MHGEIYNFIEKITYLDQFFSDQRFQSVTSHKGHAKETRLNLKSANKIGRVIAVSECATSVEIIIAIF